MNPHFLQNALNAVAWLCISDAKAARDMLGLLSRFLRKTYDAPLKASLPSKPSWSVLSCYATFKNDVLLRFRPGTNFLNDDYLQGSLLALSKDRLLFASREHGGWVNTDRLYSHWKGATLLTTFSPQGSWPLSPNHGDPWKRMWRFRPVTLALLSGPIA